MSRIIHLPESDLRDRGWADAERAAVQVVLDGYQALIEGADTAHVAATYSPGYRDHASTVPGGDLDSLVAMVQQSTEQFPGTEIELRQILVDGDRVVVYSQARRRAEDRWDAVMEIFRVEGGLIAEHWETIEPAGFFDVQQEGTK